MKKEWIKQFILVKIRIFLTYFGGSLVYVCYILWILKPTFNKVNYSGILYKLKISFCVMHLDHSAFLVEELKIAKKVLKIKKAKEKLES
ncbi:hypothetical protein QVD17_29375 [Tagetes erecta]|uniref:Uncharacterized protein n=1 Tax=Tagetes erecta TaxID=13708 RepID=A0AAD8KEM7_TARER|nr:hypothetical protein QVD17_29375 [Tagetes erecta]